MKKVLILLTLITTFITISCQNEYPLENDFSINSENPSVPIDSKTISIDNSSLNISTLRTSESQIDALTRKFAISLAKSLADPKLRTYLKKEAENQFDGDFDILYASKKNLEVGRKKLNEIIIESGEISETELNELLKLNPKLNISVPINIDKWESNSHAPIVIYIGAETIENETPTLLGFDYKGALYSVNAIDEPSVPVIVVGTNERVDENNNVRKAFLETESRQYGLIYMSSARLMACTPPYRTNNEWLRLNQVRMNVGTYESWWRGKAELMIKCFAPNMSTSNTYTENIYESSEINVYRDQSNDWINRQFPLFYWNNAIRTQSVLFYFYEFEGNGSSVEINISGSYKVSESVTVSPGTKFTIKSGDKTIGRFIVDQFACPPNSDQEGRKYYQINPDFAFSIDSYN